MTFEELNGYQNAVKATKRFQGKVRIELRKLNRFISSCNDPLVRNILIEHYLKGNSWVATANRIGGGITGDNCRMLVVRYIDSRRKK